jgi:hypothetical protein
VNYTYYTIQSIIMNQSNVNIIHICANNKGGTEKYVTDLITLFSNYTHIIVHTSPFEIANIEHLRLIHIHSTF